MKLNSGSNPSGQILWNDFSFLSDEEMQQSPYYTRVRLSEGVRTIWFPIDEARFEFNGCYNYMDRTELPFSAGHDGPEYFKQGHVYSTKMIKDDGTFVYGTGTNTTGEGVAYADANELGTTSTALTVGNLIPNTYNVNLRHKVRLEWAINFVGV